MSVNEHSRKKPTKGILFYHNQLDFVEDRNVKTKYCSKTNLFNWKEEKKGLIALKKCMHNAEPVPNSQVIMLADNFL